MWSFNISGGYAVMQFATERVDFPNHVQIQELRFYFPTVGGSSTDPEGIFVYISVNGNTNIFSNQSIGTIPISSTVSKGYHRIPIKINDVYSVQLGFITNETGGNLPTPYAIDIIYKTTNKT